MSVQPCAQNAVNMIVSAQDVRLVARGSIAVLR